MAGTTGLEPAASAVTGTDSALSRWKYIIVIAIVYRDVYRALRAQTQVYR